MCPMNSVEQGQNFNLIERAGEGARMYRQNSEPNTVNRRGLGTTWPLIVIAAVIAATSGARPVDADEPRAFDPSPAWPLCGRINEAPPAGWSAVEDGCPVTRWGNPDYADYPLTAGYGARILATENRYDFHPGLDIPTALGTPVFAVTGGVVRKVAGTGEVRVEIQHYRTGSWGGDCAPGGCYHSVYQHLQSAAVAENQRVRKGQLVGYSGASASGFAHLHLELRDAPPEDGGSSWIHDAISPLRVLPYHENTDGTVIALSNVDTSDPMNPQVTVQIVQHADPDPALDMRRYDIDRIEVQIYDNRTKTLVRQPGMVSDDNGFHVNPSLFAMELRNHQYTHKDGGSQPWESFDSCPYSYDHGLDYDADIHTCKHDDNDVLVGSFNGIEIRPTPYSSGADYQLSVTFKELIGVIDAADLCVVANVRNVRGSPSGQPTTWNCTF